MTSIDTLKQEPVFFFTSVPIAPFGQGSSMRVYTNLRAYLDLGFRVELIHFVTEENQSKALILPEGEIHFTQLPQDARGLRRFAGSTYMASMSTAYSIN